MEIINIQHDEIDKLTFEIYNVDVSIINSIRRVILSNINCLIFNGFPYENNNINFIKNTTKFNNEYMKHRISCIPIMNSNINSFQSIKETYKAIINVTNDTNEKKYVTTNDFQIINKVTNSPMEKSDIENYFKKDSITKDDIIISILYPNFNKNEENETLYFECDFDIGCAKDNSCWNVVHNCTYEFIQDKVKVNQEKEKIKDEIKKKDFEILDAQRIIKPNSFKFTVQTLGIFTNYHILTQACDYIMYCLEKIIDVLKNIETIGINDEIRFEQNEETLSYCNIFKDNDFYVFELKDDDYTIGKIIEKQFYSDFVRDIEMIAFKKEHSTKKEAFIYIKYNKNNKSNDDKIVKNIISVCDELHKKYSSIKDKFTSKK